LLKNIGLFYLKKVSCIVYSLYLFQFIQMSKLYIKILSNINLLIISHQKIMFENYWLQFWIVWKILITTLKIVTNIFQKWENVRSDKNKQNYHFWIFTINYYSLDNFGKCVTNKCSQFMGSFTTWCYLRFFKKYNFGYNYLNLCYMDDEMHVHMGVATIYKINYVILQLMFKKTCTINSL